MNSLPIRAFPLLLFMSVLDAPAQDILQDFITRSGDVAEVKRKAEAGDARAQHQLANTLATRNRAADALYWYSKAAQQGSLESLYRMGHMLLFGAPGLPREQGVAPKPVQGVQILFTAVKNGHTDASYDLYRAHKDGLGVAKDMVQAYAWLQFHADKKGGILPSGARFELNNLALQVDVPTSQEGKRLAALWKSGRWPSLKLQAPAEPKTTQPASQPAASRSAPAPSPALKLNGIALGQTPMAIINGKTLAVGETATLPTQPQPCVIKCLKIDRDSVLITIGEDPTPHELRLR